jgi:hypothetical protein
MVLAIIGGLFVSGLLEQWLWPSNNPGSKITFATADPSATTEFGKSTTSPSTYSEEQLEFSNKANAQLDLMIQAHITDQYEFFAGCFIEDLRVFVINVTCDPKDFKAKYADLLNFRIIDVRQVKYTYRELEAARLIIEQNADELFKLGMIGYGIDDVHDAVLIVVGRQNSEVRRKVAELITNADMVFYEVD